VRTGESAKPSGANEGKVLLSLCLPVCLSRSLQVQRRLFTSFFFYLFFLFLSLTPSGRRLGRGRTQRRRSVAGRSANQRTAGTSTNEKKRKTLGKREERQREGAAAGVGAPIHCVCKSKSKSKCETRCDRTAVCGSARCHWRSLLRWAALGLGGFHLVLSHFLAHAHATVPRLAWVAFVGGRYLPTLRYATLRYLPPRVKQRVRCWAG
jgi:hypothetical protein